METTGYVRWFSVIRLGDVPLVGGKNASLGELYSTLSKQGARVPNAFVLIANAYRDALTAAKAGGAAASSILRTMEVVAEAEEIVRQSVQPTVSSLEI